MYPLGTLLIMKDAGFRIRVQRDLRRKFLEVCRAQDKPAAQVIREFMRECVDRHERTRADSTIISNARQRRESVDDN